MPARLARRSSNPESEALSTSNAPEETERRDCPSGTNGPTAAPVCSAPALKKIRMGIAFVSVQVSAMRWMSSCKESTVSGSFNWTAGVGFHQRGGSQGFDDRPTARPGQRWSNPCDHGASLSGRTSRKNSFSPDGSISVMYSSPMRVNAGAMRSQVGAPIPKSRILSMAASP